MSLADALLAVLWGGLTLYAVLGGADFGAGTLHLLTPRTRAGRRLRRAIATAMGPVWEANHVWLIFFLTGLLTIFPGAFAALGAALFAPATLALLGIVVRGAAFAFAAQLGSADRVRGPVQAAFGAASAATPFVLGATAAGIARGRPGHWLGPFELAVGALAVAACTALAATFLTVEMERAGEPGLARAFRARAVRATAATGALAVLGFVLSGTLLSGRALPALVAGLAAPAVALAALRARRDRLARAAAAVAMAALVWGWGLAQYPRLAAPGVTVATAAAPAPELHAVAIALAAGAVLLVPSLWLLYVAFRRRPAQVLR
jgi:cytochrome bd ubiquinol oxidase subunit II